jgi:hypothetical protein
MLLPIVSVSSIIDSTATRAPVRALDIINIIAILLSPVIAVVVTLWHQDRKERRGTKLWLLNTLIATRSSRTTDEAVRAVNLIDVVFYDQPSVRKLWREYYDMVTNEGLQNANGWSLREKKYLELVTEMARVLGFGKEISHLDVDRVYYPQGLSDNAKKASEISEELLRVLKGTQGLATTPLKTEAKSDPVPL